MEAKHIPEEPILKMLSKNPDTWHNWYWDDELDIRRAFPKDTPSKLVLYKMKSLMRRGLVDGCFCGCRGDFTLTEKGKQYVINNNYLMPSSISF